MGPPVYHPYPPQQYLPPQSPSGYGAMHYSGPRVVNPDGSSYVYPPQATAYPHAHMIYPHANYPPGGQQPMPPLAGPVPVQGQVPQAPFAPPVATTGLAAPSVVASPTAATGTQNQGAFSTTQDPVVK